MFQNSVKTRAHRPLFGIKVDGRWTWVSYAEFADKVDRFRAGLASLGVGKGDRVALISNNRLEWAVSCYAIYGLGAATVPMYEAQLDKEWKFIIGDSGAKACLCANAAIAARVQKLQPELPALAHVVNYEGGADEPTSFVALSKKGAERPVAAVIPAGKDLAGLVYTSGTTGTPKGVRLTHSNLVSNVQAIASLVDLYETDRTLSFLPWAHVFGGSSELHGTIFAGGSMALCEDVAKLVDNLQEVKPTLLFAVPRIWNRLYETVQKQITKQPPLIQRLIAVALAGRKKLRNGEAPTLLERGAMLVAERLVFQKVRGRLGGRLRFAISGAAALSREVAEFIDGIGIVVLEGYGLTESSSCATASLPNARRIGAVGKPIPGVRIEIDRSVAGADDESGEIVIYGHGVMDGYYNNPDETAKTLTADGGLRTGDLGKLDKDGFLFITGRVKELYKLENGKYVAPVPLEEKYQLSPFISQVMVHGSGKPFNVAVIVPDMKELEKWAGANGVSGDVLASDKTRGLINQELEKLGKGFKGFERVKSFVLTKEEFSTANDMLTPTLKIKRRNVIKKYGASLDRLYEDKALVAAAG